MYIPDTVEDIGVAFANCNSLRQVIFGENTRIRRLGNNCFSHTQIQRIVIPRNVTEIGANAFHSCPLFEVKFEDGSKLQKIGSCAFYDTRIS